MQFIKLSTAVNRLQKSYGKNKIDRQLVLDMLDVIGVNPYYNAVVLDDYYILSQDWETIDNYIHDYSKGAPVHEIFNIGL